ncbi:MAG: hypothetical protein AB7V13_01740 [Pseudorhodoplanes sp.]
MERRLDEREGTSIARDIDQVWMQLSDDEREALEYLLLTGARSCVGNCSEPLLSRLVGRGLLMWPPGVRPVLTDDLVTSFLIPPAVWDALQPRRRALSEQETERLIEAGKSRFSEQFTPLVTSEITSDPFRPSGLD